MKKFLLAASCTLLISIAPTAGSAKCYDVVGVDNRHICDVKKLCVDGYSWIIYTDYGRGGLAQQMKTAGGCSVPVECSNK